MTFTQNKNKTSIYTYVTIDISVCSKWGHSPTS